MSDLVERLRQSPVFAQPAESQRCTLVMAEAADTIEALRDVLQEALGRASMSHIMREEIRAALAKVQP